MVFSKDRSCDGNFQFRFEIHPSGFVVVMGMGVRMYVGAPSVDPGGWGSDFHSPQALPLNTWTAIALVRQQNNLTLYLNGVAASHYQTPAVENHQNPAHLRLGSRFPPSGSTAENPFPGELTNGRCYLQALSADKIAELSGIKSKVDFVGREVFIRAKHSGKVLDITGSSKANSAQLIQYQQHGGPNQRFWFIKHDEEDSYSIINKNSFLVLDVTGASQADCTEVIQFGYHGGDNQRFTLSHHDDDDTWEIKAKHSGKVFDVRGGADDVIQYTPHGGPNQRFSILLAK